MSVWLKYHLKEAALYKVTKSNRIRKVSARTNAIKLQKNCLLTMGLEKVYFRVAGIVGFSGSLTLVLINWLEVGVADAWLWMAQGLVALACAAVVVKTFMSATVSGTQPTDRLQLLDGL
ncbi:MAG: hypothetical protein VW831_14890, partial [Gammaproteobacteria bacterium]